MKNQKTKEEIFAQAYMSPQDLKMLMPTMGIDNCREQIKAVRKIMKEKNIYVPKTKPLLALTKEVKKYFKI